MLSTLENNMIDEFTLAYTAGLMDGEGCITILHEKHGRTLPFMRIQICNSNHDVIEWLCITYSGSLSLQKRSIISKRDVYCFKLNGYKAAEFLKMIVPYLRIKKTQAELAIEFQSRKRNDGTMRYSRVRITEDERRIQEKMSAAMSDLNMGYSITI